MWNVAIVEGMYWQTCLDPECKFRGDVKDLPSSVTKSLSERLLDQAISVDKDFEKALLDLEKDRMKKNAVDDEDGGQNKGSSFEEVDDEFNEALLNLTLSDTQKLDEENQNSKPQSPRTKDDNLSDTKKDRQDPEESFDSEFATALMKELTMNPSSCG